MTDYSNRFIRSMYGAGRSLSQTERHLMSIVTDLESRVERLEHNVSKTSEGKTSSDRRGSDKGTGQTISSDGVQQHVNTGGVGVSGGTKGRNKQTKVRKKTTDRKTTNKKEGIV